MNSFQKKLDSCFLGNAPIAQASGFVIPANAGIQDHRRDRQMDPRFRGDDRPTETISPPFAGATPACRLSACTAQAGGAGPCGSGRPQGAA
jgi:hypothetical protein